MAASDRINIPQIPLNLPPAIRAKAEANIKQGMDPKAAVEQAMKSTSTVTGKTPSGKPIRTQPPIAGKIPTVKSGVDSYVKPLQARDPMDKYANLKPISFTGGMDYPPIEENTNAVDVAQLAEAVKKIQPTPAPVAKAEVPVAQPVTAPVASKPVEMSGKVQLYFDDSAKAPSTDLSGITTQSSLANTVRDRLAKNEPGKTTYTSGPLDAEGQPSVITSNTPTTEESVTINSTAPLSPEEYEKRKKGIEDAKQQRLDLSNQYKTSRLNSEEELRGIQDIDLASAREGKYKELMASLDSNRKRELWDKLIEAGGKVAAGVLGLANVPGLPQTKGLDIASHFKYSPAFNREAEDKQAKEIFEVKKGDIEQTFKEKIAAIKQNVDLDAKTERDLVKEANTEFINAMDKLNNPPAQVSSTLKSGNNIKETRPWKAAPIQETGVVWNPEAYKNRQNQVEVTVKAINDAVKSTRSDTFFNYGQTPKLDNGVNINPKFIPQLDKLRDAAKEEVIDRNFGKIKSDAKRKQWESYKQNPNIPEADKRAFFDDMLINQMSGGFSAANAKSQVNELLAGPLQRKAQLQVSAPNDQESINNMREVNEIFSNISTLPVDQQSTKGPKSTVRADVAPVTGETPSQQSGWVGTKPNGEKRVPIVPRSAATPTNDEVYNVKRSEKDVGLFVSPDVAQPFLGKYNFTLREEQFLPGKFSADGSSTLIGFGNLIPKIRKEMTPDEVAVAKKKQAKAEELDAIFNKYVATKPTGPTDLKALVARKNLAEQYKSASRDFYLSELNKHDPFIAHKEWFKNPTVANYWKNPNKQAVLFDLSWHGGPESDDVAKVVNLVNRQLEAGKGRITPEADAAIAAEIAKIDPQIGHGTLGSTAPRSKRRAALWLGKQAK